MARKPRKPGAKVKKRRYIHSKSTKGLTGKAKKKAAKRNTDAVGWYQQLRSEVIKFYKEEYETTKLDKEFIKARTSYAYAALKKAAPQAGITKTSFKRFVVSLDEILTKPPITVLEKDSFVGGEKGIEYWELENYFKDYREDLKQYKEIVVDGQSVVPNLLETGSAPEEINCQSVFRDIRSHFQRKNKSRKTEESDVLWFNIFRSKNGVQIVFELTDVEPDDVIKPESGGTAPTITEEDEEPEEVTKPGGKTVPTAPKPPDLPITRTSIKEEERAAEIHTIDKLERKKNSYRKDIKFNGKEIDKLTKLIKLYESMGISHDKELTRLQKLEDTNENLFGKIDIINDQLDKI